MNEEKFEMFSNRLEKVYRHVAKQARRLELQCFRVYDHDLPEFPVCVERYGENLYVAEYRRNHGMSEEEHDQWMETTLQIISEKLGVVKENIFLKLRQRKPGRLGQYQKLDGQRNEFEVEEQGLKFLVNLTDYLDTGLFLDHRITREMVRSKSSGKKVLNLFAYTGSFSVYAAAGGASLVHTIDLSNTYINWSKRNMELNGYSDTARYLYSAADVKQWLAQPPDTRYDIIVMDPPSFSNSKKMDDILDVQRDHVTLINQCLALLEPDGILYFSTNLTSFRMETGMIHTLGIKDITRQTTPFDFEGKLKRWCYVIRH